MAKNPDPMLELTTTTGVTRTLDDWTTMFHLCLVVLPARPEAAIYVPIGRRIFATFGDADCNCSFVVAGPVSVADRLLGPVERDALTFVDPDLTLVRSLGLERLPAFVHLIQDTTVLDAAQGWEPREWKRVARAVGDVLAWTVPLVAGPGDPPATRGWAVSEAA